MNFLQLVSLIVDDYDDAKFAVQLQKNIAQIEQ
jgi:hypothetical protein